MCLTVSVPGSVAQCCHGKTDLLDSITAMSISSRDKEAKTRLLFLNTLRNPDSELTAAKSLSPRKRLLERCFNRLSELEAVEPVSYTSTVKHKNQSLHRGSDFVPLGKSVAIHSPQSEYKSFRTRRSSADCNITVRRSRLSNVRLEKHETAISLWLRASERAAKIGRGLARNDKALKLASHHWLEAIDVRHRRGRNLHFYYEEWLNSHTRQPFFCWLDDGEGKALNLVDKCPRSKLEEQCIKYLTPKERKPFEVIVKDGKLLYKQTGKLLHTTEDAKWIFVLSTSKILYVGKKKKGHFHHSSFLAGGATIAAGSLVIESGTLKAVWPHSGHYCPVEENVVEFNKFLRENSIDLADVKMFPVVAGGCSIGHREEETVSDATHEAKGSAWNSSTFIRRIRFNLSKFNLKWLIFAFISFLSRTNFIWKLVLSRCNNPFESKFL